MKAILTSILRYLPIQIAYAHCDIPCGVYDPHAAQYYAKGAARMVELINKATPPDGKDPGQVRNYHNNMTRYILVKEEQARKCKEEILILWTDYFKPEHLEKFPDLHDTFWKAAKLCSQIKQTVDENVAKNLTTAVDHIAEIFHETQLEHKH